MKDKPETWKRKTSKQIADCRVFKVREDFSVSSDGKSEHTFYVVENPDWVNVIACDKQENVVLIEQFRHGTEEITLEIPGGMVDKDEEPIIAAARELVEETGYAAREMIPLGKTRPNPALQNNWIHHFLALDCEVAQNVAFDEHESIATKLVSFEQLEELIKTEQITHSLVLAAFYKLKLKEAESETNKTA